MSDIEALRILLAAGEALAASVALPVLARLAVRAFPHRAGLRHLMWASVFAGLLALPVLMALIPGQAAIHVAAPVAEAPVAHAVLPAATAPTGFRWLEPGWPLALNIAGAVWLGGVLWTALRALAAVAGLETLRRRGTLHDIAGLDVPAQAADGRCWELRLSKDCPGPMTWGLVRPTVMLPAAALTWSPERMRAVLRHELAHVRRRDSLVQALALTACALYWPNPLMWKALAALRREAEMAADDAVIAAGVRASDYASQLLDLAREWRGQRHGLAGMAMAAPAALTERVQSILSPNSTRTGATAMDILKLVFAGCLITAAMAGVRPSIAQTNAPPAPVAPIAPRPSLAPVAPAAAKPAAPEAPQAAPRPPRAPAIEVKPLAQRETRPLTPEESAELDRQLAEIGPKVRKALDDAHIDMLVARQVQAESAQARAERTRQLAELGPRIQKALDEARIEETVARRLADIQPRIDEALARAREARREQEGRRDAAPSQP